MKQRFNLTQLAVLSFFFSLLMISSCQKENSQTGTDEQQQMEASKVSSESDGESEIVFNGLFDDVIGVNDEVGIGGTGVFGRVTACPDVTVVRLNPPAPFPVKVILDYGAGCTGNDGHMRRGKVITVYTGRLLMPGSVATTTFDGFYFDSTKVEGTHKITNISTPVAVNTPPADRKFRVEVIAGKLTKPNGNFIEWDSNKEIVQVEGLGTIIPLDDIFKITGNAHGRVKRGNLIVLWESTITEPLFKRFNCRWIVKGRVRTVRINTNISSPWVAVLDFGAGNCDNQAVITINGVSHQITLP